MISIIEGDLKYIEDLKECISKSILEQFYFSDKDKTESFFKEGIEKKEIFVAVNEQKDCLGFIRIDWNFAYSEYPLLRTIAVKPLYRGKGIGTKLLEHFECLSFKKVEKVFLFVSQLNSKARKLYERKGYFMVGAIPGLYSKDGIVEVLLMKQKNVVMEYVI
jgi:ribosomal protein S18 acetylase RimI-like enzyme